MSKEVFKDHFSSGSSSYAAYRPTYPPALIDFLAGISPGLGRALDCGCGTGQLSVLLADRFAEVVATDASAAQIENAQVHDRVTYKTALAEDSGLAPASVDLITVAQAAHWLDLEKFYAEVRRVAAPGAVVALIAYGVLHVDGAAADAVLKDFHYIGIGPYWPPERQLVEEGYRSLPFPFAELKAPPLAIEVEWGLEDILGYVGTWSAVKAAHKALGIDPLEKLRADLVAVWGGAEVRRKIVWPLSLRVGRV